MPTPVNASAIGRLLEEVSWEGSAVAGYRHGGHGRENVLTAEVLQALDFLPRRQFLGEVMATAHGAKGARSKVCAEIEDLQVTLLPDETRLGRSGIVVQPDVVMESPSTHTLVEAKRILASSFQPEQLAREYLALMQDAVDKTPLLLLILGSPPPVLVRRQGRLGVPEALLLHLPSVHARSGSRLDLVELEHAVSERVSWITWAEISGLVERQAASMVDLEPSIAGTVRRLSTSLVDAIRWHSVPPPRPATD